MLTRQCRSQLLVVYPQQRLLLRSFSTGNDEDHTRRLLRRRMSIVQHPADIVGGQGLGRWDEAPPTFSWSRGAVNGGVTDLPLERPKGVHYQVTDIGSSTSAFLSAIFKPITTFFPTRIDVPPPPPPPSLITTTPTATRALRDLEEGIMSTTKSLKWVSAKHKALKAHSPYLQLNSRVVVTLFQRLLEAGMYKRFLEVLESEDVLAMEGVDLVWLALEKYDAPIRRDILEGLCETCNRQRRQRFRAMLMGLGYRVEKDLHEDVLNETAQMLSQILVVEAPTEKGYAAEVAKAESVKTLCEICDRIATGTIKISVETSQAIFRRFLELGAIDKAVTVYALKPAINVPGSHNIAWLCNSLCDKFRYQDAYKFILEALKVHHFGFMSDIDVRAGVRTVDKLSYNTEDELVDLWEALNSSHAISIRDITKNTFAAFIGRASRLRFGRRTQWWEGNGATPLLRMCMEIIILRLRGEVNINHLATLIEAWVWNWQGDEEKRVDTTSLDESIPFLPNFLDILTEEQIDQVLTTVINRITANCRRRNNEIFPVRVLWPFVSSVAKSKLWRNEESVGLWALEGAVLRKGLAGQYLSFRTDTEIARFVIRQYLPFRLALESSDNAAKENAKAVFVKLRSMPDGVATITAPDGTPQVISPFVHAILAFKDTGIPTRTLLLDMVYTLFRLHRAPDIVELLRALNTHGIRPSSSQYALLVRTLTPLHPNTALDLLKLYAKSQYSTFASYIASTALNHPHLALSAYRFLTRPNVYPFTPDQPCLAPRRHPKRRLLLAMAWKFANSPALSARQALRWVKICYGTMLKLGYPPGPTMGLAVAVAGVQRPLKEGVPVRSTSKRQRWVLQVVKRQAGRKKAEEAASMIARAEEERRVRRVWRERGSGVVVQS